MADKNSIDEPSPTIVGPQPSDGGGSRQLSVPRGIERLVELAGRGAEWRLKVLADPLHAAGEAGLELTASERAIFASVPRQTLKDMIDSLGQAATSSRPLGAEGVRSATSVRGSVPDEPPSSSKKDEPSRKEPMKPPPMPPPAPTGIRPDIPKPKRR